MSDTEDRDANVSDADMNVSESEKSQPKSLAEMARAVAMVMILAAVSAIFFGYVWVAVGWMRFYGLEPGVVASAVPLDTIDYKNGFLNAVAQLVDLYNISFQGNARFGSGIGVIAGACASLLLLQHCSRPTKIVSAAVAGAAVGGRFCLTFTSAPAPFLLMIALGAFSFALIQFFVEEKLPSLPAVGEHFPSEQISQQQLS